MDWDGSRRKTGRGRERACDGGKGLNRQPMRQGRRDCTRQEWLRHTEEVWNGVADSDLNHSKNQIVRLLTNTRNPGGGAGLGRGRRHVFRTN